MAMGMLWATRDVDRFDHLCPGHDTELSAKFFWYAARISVTIRMLSWRWRMMSRRFRFSHRRS